MLFNISHNDKKIKKTIEESVGKPFGLIENFKLKGTGSPKLIITKANAEISTILSKNNSINYSNIELRPNGIIIGFKSQLEVYALVIPFYKLVYFKPGSTITFHIDHHFISFDCSKNGKKMQEYILKIESQKAKSPYDYNKLD